jgi:hypothetical protein
MNGFSAPLLLNNRYARVGEAIGRSDRSIVYQYLDTHRNAERVAIKFVASVSQDDMPREFFERETAALSRTRHPNIIELKDSGFEPNVGYWLVLEYAGGGSLEQESVRARFRSPAELSRLLLVCAKALLHAHCEHILHRDLKPGNVLLFDDLTPKIADFNVSKIVGAVRSRHTVRQYLTPRYAAPEQIAGKTTTDKADIFSLGLVIAELMSPRALDVRDSINHLPDIYPGPLRRIVRLMCNPDPTGRPALSEVISELTGICRSYGAQNKVYARPTKTALERVASVHGCAVGEALEIVRRDLEGHARLALGTGVSKNGDLTYTMFGERFRYFILPSRPDTGFQELIITGAAHLPASQREQRRRESIDLPIAVLVVEVGAPVPANFGVDQFEDLHAESENEWQAARVDSRRRDELIAKWETYVDLAREAQQGAPVGSVQRVTLTTDDLFEIDVAFDTKLQSSLLEGQQLTCTSEGGFTTPLGTIVSRDGPRFTVRPHDALPKDYVVVRGSSLGLDIRREEASLIRQRRALIAVKQNAAVIPDLAALLVDPSVVDGPHARTITPVIPDLHSENKKVVEIALGTRQLFLVQGPPGTGKTTVLTELVAQILAGNPTARILLSSQSNVAVDNVLERLAVVKPDVNAVRLGRSEKIDTATKRYELETVVQATAKAIGESAATARRTLERLQEKGKKTELLTLRKLLLDESTADDALDLMSDVIGGHVQSHDYPVEYCLAAERLAELSEATYTRLREIQDFWIDQVSGVGTLEQHTLQTSQVVAGTCIGFSSNRTAAELEYDWVIVDEAGRASPPELLVPMVRGRRLVLVGDHRQLPPILDDAVVRKVAHKLSLQRSDLTSSLFEDLYERLPAQAKSRLIRQYRMHPIIGEMISSVFYDSQLTHGVTAEDRPLGQQIFGSPTRWLNTAGAPRRSERRMGTSYVNEYEADVLLSDLARALPRLPVDRSRVVKIGILTGYNAQKELIEDRVAPFRDTLPVGVTLEVLTVDAAQGREFEIVYYSGVRSNVEERIGFLSDERRLNVALSRARDALTIVGDQTSLTGAGNIFGINPFRRLVTYSRNTEHGLPILSVK